MKRAFLAAVFLASAPAWPQAAPPGNTIAQAAELASRLGRERSVDGLETIIKSGNPDLVSRYVSGFASGPKPLAPGATTAPIPREIEALMIRFYRDPAVGRRLPALCFGWRCQTRELFDLMLADLRRDKPHGETYNLMHATLNSQAPGSDAALLDWLNAPDAPKGDDLVRSLGQRKYAPAVSSLARVMNAAPPGTGSAAQYSLLQIGTPEAIDALLARGAANKRVPVTPAILQEARTLGGNLLNLPVASWPPYSRLRASMPDEVREYSTHWLSKRKDLGALPDALVLLLDPVTYPGTLSAIIATDSPDAWRRAREALLKSQPQKRLQEGQHQHALKQLDDKLANPDKHFAEKRSSEQDQKFFTHRALLDRDLQAAFGRKANEPDRYVAGVVEYTTELRKLAAEYPDSFAARSSLRDTVPSLRFDVGHFVRFHQKRPRDALVHYEAASKDGSIIAAFAAADTLQYDLKDPKRALEAYRKLVKSVPPLPPEAFGFDSRLANAAFYQRWLAAQIAYLENGKTFSGPLKPEDMAIAQFVMTGAAPVGDPVGIYPQMLKIFEAAGSVEKVDRQAVERALRGTPPSTFALGSSAPFVSFMPSADAILAHFARLDPAGYATAAYFGTLDVTEKLRGAEAMAIAPGMRPGSSDPMRVARARFLRDRRIDLTAVQAFARNVR